MRPNHSNFVNTDLGDYILQPDGSGWRAITNKWTDAGNKAPVPHGHYKAVMYAMMYDNKTLDEATAGWFKPEPLPGRTGKVRIHNRAWIDDGGPFYSLSVSCFALLSQSHNWINKNLRWLQQAGIENLRILGMVGTDYWVHPKDLTIDPLHDSDYWNKVELRFQMARDNGFRFKLVLFADAQVMMPNEHDKFEYAQRWIDYTKDKEDWFLHIEIANEWWQNGFGDDIELLHRLTNYVKERTNIPVAESSPLDKNYEQVTEGDLFTDHPDRDKREEGWRPTRQMWRTANEVDMPRSNNEPIGPGSSGEETSRAKLLITDCLTTHISGGLDYTLHMEAGIAGKKFANYEDHVNASKIQKTFRNSRKLLPPDIANWSRQNHHWNGHPFKDSLQHWVDGHDTGVNRGFAAVDGNKFVVLLSAIKHFVDPIPPANVKYDIIDVLTGNVIETVEQRKGQSHRIHGNMESKLLKGEFI